MHEQNHLRGGGAVDQEAFEKVIRSFVCWSRLDCESRVRTGRAKACSVRNGSPTR
jgi:hypothetical protein